MTDYRGGPKLSQEYEYEYGVAPRRHSMSVAVEEPTWRASSASPTGGTRYSVPISPYSQPRHSASRGGGLESPSASSLSPGSRVAYDTSKLSNTYLQASSPLGATASPTSSSPQASSYIGQAERVYGSPGNAASHSVQQQMEALQRELKETRSRMEEVENELKRSRDVCKEMLTARRQAREALADMAQQNQRLVQAYVEKKDQAKKYEEQLTQREQATREVPPPEDTARTEQMAQDLEAARQEAQILRRQLAEAQSLPSPGQQEDNLRAKRVHEENDDLRIENHRLKKEVDRLSVKVEDLLEEINGLDPSPASTVPPASAVPQATRKGNLQRWPTPKTVKIHAMGVKNAALQEENEQIKKDLQEIESRAQRRENAEAHKQQATVSFQKQDYKEAVESYSKAIDQNVEDETYNAVLYCNRAACHYSLGSYLQCLADCCTSAALDPAYPRVYHRRADAYQALGDYSNAYNDMIILHDRLGKSGADVDNRLQELKDKANANTSVNHYLVLNVSQASTDKEIKTAYRKAALVHHPDKTATAVQRVGAEVIFKMLSDAHRVLTSPDSRTHLDKVLRKSQG